MQVILRFNLYKPVEELVDLFACPLHKQMPVTEHYHVSEVAINLGRRLVHAGNHYLPGISYCFQSLHDADGVETVQTRCGLIAKQYRRISH